MRNEELIASMRDLSAGPSSYLQDVGNSAADRIEALVKERDRYRDAFNTNCLVLRGTEERVERLEAALRRLLNAADGESYAEYFNAIENGHAALKGADQ